ncbi:hypothetical protein CBF34_00520 [Vagococcus penaei]|uniref:Uncharacterized protein n=1 Tax=Vagococcus penaei TaxID=633807 RepID=A0A1Q2D5D4_9ENTE|nr:hypothetical protein [Vagococcus penaei]AQP53579.1 hypothetical protein BW732_04600 [Vagococcus penaei]RSU07524.1 hypothetical protein CBF34_00520 [Vagococcus penaei]
MMTTLKNNFMQATVGSTLWITLIISFRQLNEDIPFHFVWNILGIGLLFGLVFGIIYPYLWEYSTFKARINILISTIANVACGFLGVRLYSVEMFDFIAPYWIGVIGVTLIGHIIGFYFYSNYKNKQLKKELNQLI